MKKKALFFSLAFCAAMTFAACEQKTPAPAPEQVDYAEEVQSEIVTQPQPVGVTAQQAAAVPAAPVNAAQPAFAPQGTAAQPQTGVTAQTMPPAPQGQYAPVAQPVNTQPAQAGAMQGQAVGVTPPQAGVAVQPAGNAQPLPPPLAQPQPAAPNTPPVTSPQTAAPMTQPTAAVQPQLSTAAYYGVYEGLLPAADGPGIQTTLTLNQDGTFTLVSDYVDRNFISTEQGTYDRSGTLLSARTTDGQTYYYQIQDGSVRQLDGQRRPVTGPLAEHYVLKQTKK